MFPVINPLSLSNDVLLVKFLLHGRVNREGNISGQFYRRTQLIVELM